MRVLILYATVGAGHKRAAEALMQAFVKNDRRCDAVLVDILEYTPWVFRETYGQGYARLVRRMPELWGYMYERSDRNSPRPWRKWVRSAFNKINARAFFDFFDGFSPDVAVCTHFMPLDLLSSALQRGDVSLPVFAVVTDFAVHSLWMLERVACYYVATDEAARHLVRRGQPADRVSVTGIPVDSSFARAVPQAVARDKLGLRGNLPVVLLLSGGVGIGPTVELIRSFRRASFPCQLVVVAGANRGLERKAREAAARAGTADGMNTRVHGYVGNMHELMDASDVIISKPGGLTSSEVLAKARPLVIVDPVPGQEQRNCEYLLEAGAAVRLFEIEDAPHKVQALLADGRRMAQMRRNAARVAKPNAAADIVRDVLAKYGARRRAEGADHHALD